jgi:uncharacterized protein YacL
MREAHVAGAALARRESFVRLGIADTSIIWIAAEPYLVLTEDFRLNNFLAFQNRDVLNINHIRGLGEPWRPVHPV